MTCFALLAALLASALPKPSSPGDRPPLPAKPSTTSVSEPTAPAKACKPGTRQFVRAGAQGGDGGETRPFGTLGEALAHAKKAGWCAADLRVAPGTYTESVVVDRHTSVRRWDPGRPRTGKVPGASAPAPKSVVLRGAIESHGPYRTTVERIVIEDAPGAAAISSTHKKAETRLDRVTIKRARQRGIQHTGGKLSATDVAIVGTQRVDDDVTTGIAIALASGTIARLERVKIRNTSAQALRVRGSKTRVVAEDLDIVDVEWHPAASETVRGFGTMPEQGDGHEAMGFGAILVDQGSFYADGLSIADVFYSGVIAHRSGRVRMRHAKIVDAQQIEFFADDGTPTGWFGGMSVAAAGEATLDIAEFTFRRSPRSGVGMMSQASGSFRDGKISDTRVGIQSLSAPIPNYRLPDCVRDVRFVRTEYEFDYGRVAPAAEQSLDEVIQPGQPPPSVCPSIPPP